MLKQQHLSILVYCWLNLLQWDVKSGDFSLNLECLLKFEDQGISTSNTPWVIIQYSICSQRIPLFLHQSLCIVATLCGRTLNQEWVLIVFFSLGQKADKEKKRTHCRFTILLPVRSHDLVCPVGKTSQSSFMVRCCVLVHYGQN